MIRKAKSSLIVVKMESIDHHKHDEPIIDRPVELIGPLHKIDVVRVRISWDTGARDPEVRNTRQYRVSDIIKPFNVTYDSNLSRARMLINIIISIRIDSHQWKFADKLVLLKHRKLIQIFE